jgi:hypothetical protein
MPGAKVGRLGRVPAKAPPVLGAQGEGTLSKMRAIQVLQAVAAQRAADREALATATARHLAQKARELSQAAELARGIAGPGVDAAPLQTPIERTEYGYDTALDAPRSLPPGPEEQGAIDRRLAGPNPGSTTEHIAGPYVEQLPQPGNPWANWLPPRRRPGAPVPMTAERAARAAKAKK